MPALFEAQIWIWIRWKRSTYLARFFKWSQSVKTLVGLGRVVPVRIFNIEDDTVALFYKLSTN